MLEKGELYTLENLVFYRGIFNERIKHEDSMYVGNHNNFSNRFFFIKPYTFNKESVVCVTNLYGIVIGEHYIFDGDKKTVFSSDFVSINDLLDFSPLNYDVITRTRDLIDKFHKTYYSCNLLSIIDNQIKRYDVSTR